MSREDIVALVRKIRFGIVDNDAIDELLDRLEDALPQSDICDLIFQDFRELTPEQVAGGAMQQQAERSAKVLGSPGGTDP